MLMQSSGVGNTINALAMPNVCRVPFVTIVSMRGEWGEFVPWQVPMGKATPDVFEAMGVTVYRANHSEEVRETITAAAVIVSRTSSEWLARYTVTPIASNTSGVAFPIGTCQGTNSPHSPRIETMVTKGTRHTFGIANALIVLPTPLLCISMTPRCPPSSADSAASC